MQTHCCRDCGFCVYLGDELNGYRAEGQRSSWAEVERWLDEQDRIHYRTASTHAPKVPNDLPTARTLLEGGSLRCLVCAKRATSGARRLQAIIDRGRNDVSLKDLKL